MSAIRNFRIGDWFCRARKAQHMDNAFVAWGAKTPNLGRDPLDVDFARECHICVAITLRLAIALLKQEILTQAMH